MPYINKLAREALDRGVRPALEPGELNYKITQVINQYLDSSVANYTTYNAVVGALESAKLEFYRRVVSPYEDKKIKENGDVYNVA